MNLYKSNRLRFLVVLVLMLGLTVSASAAFFRITAPNTPLPNQKSYSQSAADYWKWVYGNNEVGPNDTTGASCKVGQPLLGTWYLAMNWSDLPSVTRNCTIPVGRTLLIPIVSVAIGAGPGDSPAQKEVEFVRARTRNFIADSENFSLTIDGSPVPNLERYYEESTVFAVTSDGIVSDPTVDAGYYVAVSNLLPGNHTIHWHADSPTLGDQDVTYNIKVSLLPFW